MIPSSQLDHISPPLSSLLMTVCRVVSRVGSFIDHSYIGLLGFIPLLIGLFKLYQLVRAAYCPAAENSEAEDGAVSPTDERAAPLPVAEIEMGAQATQGSVQIHEQDGTVHTLHYDLPSPPQSETPVLDGEPSMSAVAVSEGWGTVVLLYLGYIINRNSLKVASVTMANGADNLGIYIPLFASSTSGQLVVILVVFFLFVGIWLLGSYLLLYFPPLAKAIAKYGDYLVPLALIGLGIYIFYDTDVLSIV